MMRQEELEQRVLVVFYEYSQKGNERITKFDLQAILDNEVGLQRIELALETLIAAGAVHGTYSMNRPAQYSITNTGYKAVEDSHFARLQQAETARAEADPIENLDQQLAPAAGRMVSFGDNSSIKDDALAAIDDAQEILRSSNQLDSETKDDAVLSLSTWSSLIKDAKNFAVGAFKFLVWDRLKAVLGSSIEEVYRTAIVGLMITLGSIIVGLL